VEGKDQSKYTDRGNKDNFSSEAALQDGARYYYKVRAVNVVEVESLDSPGSNAVTKPVPTPRRGSFFGIKLERRQEPLIYSTER
jgi:hypothetical protein